MNLKPRSVYWIRVAVLKYGGRGMARASSESVTVSLILLPGGGQTIKCLPRDPWTRVPAAPMASQRWVDAGAALARWPSIHPPLRVR